MLFVRSRTNSYEITLCYLYGHVRIAMKSPCVIRTAVRMNSKKAIYTMVPRTNSLHAIRTIT